MSVAEKALRIDVDQLKADVKWLEAALEAKEEVIAYMSNVITKLRADLALVEDRLADAVEQLEYHKKQRGL